MKTFAQVLSIGMQEQDMSVAQLARTLEVSRPTITRWMDGSTTPVMYIQTYVLRLLEVVKWPPS